MRVAVGAVWHQTNTFSNVPTTIRDFERRCLIEGDTLIETFAGREHVLAGFLGGAKEIDAEVVPTVAAYAPPGGTVAPGTLAAVRDRLCAALVSATARRVDGVLLHLHGAMVAADASAGDAQIVRRIRQVVGAGVPVVVVVDTRANLSQALVDDVSAVLVCVDQSRAGAVDRGRQAAVLLAEILAGRYRPIMALRQLPLLVPLPAQLPWRSPFRDILDLARHIEEEERVIAAGVAAGFPYADTPAAGCSAVVTTNDDPALAARLADTLAAAVWERRAELSAAPLNIETAVHAAMIGSAAPVILLDTGDDPGGGAAGEGTGLLWGLLDLGAHEAVYGVLADPAAVATAFAAGVGASLRVAVGGLTDRRAGYPLDLEARVLRLIDGRPTQYIDGGSAATSGMGRAAMLRALARHGGTVDVIVAERSVEVDDPAFFAQIGIDLASKEILALKSSGARTSAMAATAGEVIEVATPGITTPDLAFFDFRRLRRPIYPLDDIW